MKSRRAVWVSCAVVLLASCATRPAPEQAVKLTVAAAANLTDVFAEVGGAFKAKTGVEVIFSYGSTAQLSQQIENGAPFDLFASADTEHVDALVAKGKLTAASRVVYATGQLTMWVPKGEQIGVRELKDLTRPQVRFIALAQPALAPYGQAAVETLTNAGLWESLKPKVVYATSISQAKQFAETGNADVAFTAFSLVLHEKGAVIKVDPQLHHPIDQALAIAPLSPQIEAAKQFRSFLLGPEGRAILTQNGYLVP